MIVFLAQVTKNQIAVRETEPMTSGSSNVYVMQFEFSDEWTHLGRTAVFKAGNIIINILLDDTNRCMIPWEVMTEPNVAVQFGVFGVMDGNVVLPTVWAPAGTMLLGVTTGIYPEPPTPDVYQQIISQLARIENKIDNGGSGGGGGVDFTVDETLNLSDESILSVSLPTKSVTKEEYDALGDEAKDADILYLVSGEPNQVIYKRQSYMSSSSSSGGGIDFTTDSTLTLSSDGVLSVTHPTVPITQAEYDALSDEEKRAEKVYLITDSEGSSIMPTPSTGGKVNYSTEEKVVGTWIDGKPVYQVTIEGTTLANRAMLPLVEGVNTVVNAHGMIGYGTAWNSFPPGIYYGIENNIATIRGLAMIRFYENTAYLLTEQVGSANTGYAKQSFTLTLQYTKVSDYESTAKEVTE